MFNPHDHTAAILREFGRACEICDELPGECQCNAWVATCNTCMMPIYGREDAGHGVQIVGAYKINIFTCEECGKKAA
jgi:hypothetical protein